MKKRGRIVAFLLLIVVFAGTIGTTTTPILKDVKLGLDLQGGFEVLYQVQQLKRRYKNNGSSCYGYSEMHLEAELTYLV